VFPGERENVAIGVDEVEIWIVWEITVRKIKEGETEQRER
jgi:hypothetical protein